jgi:hypothetical protein
MSGPTTPRTSSTPILNLEMPIPAQTKKLRSRILGFLAGVIVGLLAIVSLDRRAELPGVALFSLFAAFPAVVLVHELGHLAAGLVVGLRFNSIRVAFWTLRLEYGKLVLRARCEPAGGYAGIFLDRIYRMRRRIFWFVAGGPIASILSVVIGVNAVSFFRLQNDWVIGFLSAFVYLSLLVSLMSLVPMRKGMWSDGARLEMLARSRAQTRRWFSILGLGMQASRGIPPRSWNQNWIRSATRLQDHTVDERSACWLAYLHASDCKDAERAGTHLERCLALTALTRGSINELRCSRHLFFKPGFAAMSTRHRSGSPRSRLPPTFQNWFACEAPQLWRVRAKIFPPH